MSGALAVIGRGYSIASGAVQSATALANLFNSGIGAAGFGATLTLGGFAFTEFELPEEIACGAKQQHVLHKLPGGGRKMDIMGSDETDITWSGVFVRADAASREAQVSAMCRAGAIVPLAWGPVIVPVLISDFNIRWRDQGYYIPYTITCVPMPAPANSPDGDDEDADLSDMDGGGGIFGMLGDAADSVGTVVNDVANEAGRVLGIANGALAVVSRVVTPLTTALGIRVPFLSQAGAMIGLAQGAVGSLTSAAAGLQAISATGQYTATQLSAVDDRLDNQPLTTLPNSDDARDAAVGQRAQAGVTSARVSTLAPAVRGRAIPLPPLPPGDGPANPPLSYQNDLPIPLPPVPPVSGPTTAPLANQTVSQLNTGFPNSLAVVGGQLLSTELAAARIAPMTESQILDRLASAGRPDLYSPA